MAIFNEGVEEKIRNLLRKIGISKIIIFSDILPNIVEKKARTILDLGCGKGDPMSWINKRQIFDLRVGMDIVPKVLKIAKQRGTHDCYILGDIRHLPFREKSFDICLIVGILTYLKKEEGLSVLKTAERISRKQLIVFTPIGSLPPSKGERYDKYRYWNEEAHMSSYSISDFSGYKIIGVNGLRFFRNRRGKIRFFGVAKVFIAMPAYLSSLVLYFYPKLAFEMICTKSME